MSFIETRLMERITSGAHGGPTWSTRKVPLRSGFVRRNPNRSRPLYRFIIPNQPLDPAATAIVLGAFNACRGGVDGFRFKDPTDFRAAAELLPDLGTGDVQSVQLVKTYTFGTNAVERPIRKPVADSVVMTVNGSPLTASIDYTTGIATFTADASGVLRWSGQFDVPVTFASDEFLPNTVGKNGRGLVLAADVELEEDLSV